MRYALSHPPRLRPTFITLVALLFLTAPAHHARAHETDQHTVPLGREYADVGYLISRWAYDAIHTGVEKTNRKIEAAVKANDTAALAHLQSDAEIVPAVNGALPWAMEVINGWDRRLSDRDVWDDHPGKVLIYKEQFANIYQGLYFALDPRQIMRMWQSGSFLAFGTYMGTDKIGHFTDMGMNYWREYHKARKAGAAPADAERHAVELGRKGLIFSERGLLGYMTAGAYSNGDMAANFLGLRFYRNLTEEVDLWGQSRKPLLVRDGPYWRISPDVDPNAFLAWFFDDRFDEALNPSHYEAGMRGQLRDNIAARAVALRAHYVNRNGEPRSRRWFERRAEEFRTYYGADYGHHGPREDLVLLSDIFYAPAPGAADPKSRDATGRTPLHVAALAGDTGAMRNLLRAGAEPSAPARPQAPHDIDGGATPLHFAIREGAPDAVRLLVSVGARSDARDDRGETPLHVAAAVGDYDTVDLLLARGADPNAPDNRGRTPLHRAATFTPEPGDAPAGTPAADRIVTRLVAAGASVDARDRDGRTPLHAAASITNLPAIGALLIARASPAAADGLGVTPLHVAAARDDARVLERMLRAGAPADVADQFGSTPLFEACRRRAHRAAALLVDHGADVARADAWGQTPLAIAGRLNDRTTLATLRNARPHAESPQPAGASLSNTSPQP